MLKFPSSEYYKMLLCPILGKREITLVYSNSWTLTVSSICVNRIARLFDPAEDYTDWVIRKLQNGTYSNGVRIEVIRWRSMLEEVVLQHSEVIEQLNPQVALCLDVVFDIHQTVDFDVNGEPIASKLS